MGDSRGDLERVNEGYVFGTKSAHKGRRKNATTADAMPAKLAQEDRRIPVG